MTHGYRLLREYRRKHELSCDQFAKKLGIAESTMRSLENGTRTITAEVAKQIEDATDGEVVRVHLRPDLFGSKRSERRTAA